MPPSTLIDIENAVFFGICKRTQRTSIYLRYQ